MNKILFAAGILILLAGGIFTLLPHDLHNKIMSQLTGEQEAHEHEHDEHGSHGLHEAAGSALALLGIALAIGGWKL